MIGDGLCFAQLRCQKKRNRKLAGDIFSHWKKMGKMEVSPKTQVQVFGKRITLQSVAWS